MLPAVLILLVVGAVMVRSGSLSSHTSYISGGTGLMAVPIVCLVGLILINTPLFNS